MIFINQNKEICLIKAHRPEVIRKHSALDDLVSAESKNKNGKCEVKHFDEQSNMKSQPITMDTDSIVIEQ